MSKAELLRRVAELEEKEQRWMDFVNSGGEIFTLLDANFNYIDCNANFEKLMGLEKEEILGRNAADLSPDFVSSGRRDKYLEVMRTGMPHRFEGLKLYPRFEDRYFSVTAFKVGDGLGLSSRDMTELIRAQMAVDEVAKFPAENPNPVLRVSRDNIVLYANLASIALLDFWHTSEGGRLPDGTFGEVAEAWSNGENRETEVACGDRHFSFAIVPVAEGGYVNLYGRDITVRKKAEERISLQHIEIDRQNEVLNQQAEELQQQNEELRKVQEEMQRLNEELEDRVRERSAEVAAERRRLYEVLEALPVYVVLLDADYRVPFANRFFRERFGESRGKRCYEYLFARNEPCEICDTYKAIETGSPHRWEWTGPDGRDYDIYDFPFYEADGSLRVLEMGMDITERKKAEEALQAERENLESRIAERTQQLSEAIQALRASEERYALAQRAANIGSWDWNILSGELQWSDKIEPMFGFAPGQFEGTYEAFLNCVHPDDRELVISSVNGCLEENREYDIEHRIVWPDGSVHWVLEKGDVRRDDSGRPMRMLGIVHDITERRRLGEQILRKNAELEAANKELEAFSYSVSHDLRAPLRVLDGFSAALTEDYAGALDEQARNYIGRIRAASRNMATLIDDLLSLSRVTRAEMHPTRINLSATARAIIRSLRETTPDREVEIVIADGLAADCDSQLVKILLQNLLGNAWKFTAKKADARIEFGKTHNGKADVFFVRDNGAGFDSKYADKLFIPFQRLHSTAEFEGSGIGLAIVQRIINRHGGRVWAEGEPGRGATFYFTLKGR